MTVQLSRQLEKAKAEKDLAVTKLQTLQLTQTYRAISDDHNKRKRTAPQIEFKGEDDQLADHGRLKSIAKSRDTRRNYGGCKAIETQLKLNVVGTCPKLIVHLDDEERGRSWSSWFNGWYAKNCDGRGNRHLGDQASLILGSVIREGDILTFFDSAGVIPEGDGKVWHWEADQIATISNAEWDNHKNEIRNSLGVTDERLKLKQHHGLVTDQYGRTWGYMVSADYAMRGKNAVKFDEVLLLPAEDCTLLYNPWRMNQKRGISDMIETANIWQDIERFTESMVQRSIVQSYIAMKVKKEDSIIEARDAITDSDNPSGTPGLTSDALTSDTRYKNFEKLTQNAIEYMEPGDDVEAFQLSGDLPNAEQLIQFMQITGGWAQGLSAMYATGKADASYSASMAESNMTWMMFEWWQKWSERYFFDWIAGKALRWALSTGRILPGLFKDGHDNFSWHQWPKRRAINPAQEAAATETDLKIGAIGYDDIHGPYWKDKLKGLGEQIAYSRDNGLWVPMWTVNRSATNG